MEKLLDMLFSSSFGQKGHIKITATGTITGKFVLVEAFGDVVISNMKVGGSADVAETLKDGRIIYGNITSITCTISSTEFLRVYKA